MDNPGLQTAQYQTRKQPKTIGPYQIGDVLGYGACGKVFKGLNIINGQSVAIKQVSLNHIKEDRKGSIKTEINLLKKLDHPKIVKYIDSIYTDDHLNIVLEYVENGSLDSVVKKFGKIPETLVVLFIQQVLQGLEFLHSENVIHRDIKGGNILTTKDGVVKLADFGVSMILTQEQNSTLQSKNISLAGTPYWMAPEVINEKSEVTSACDIWSLGCTVIELITGKPPYFELNPFTAMIKIVYEESPPLPEDISDDMIDFLKKCFVKDPEKRTDAKTLLNLPMFDTTNTNSALQKIMESGSKLDLPAELTTTIKAHLDQKDGEATQSPKQELIDVKKLEIKIEENLKSSKKHSKKHSKQQMEGDNNNKQYPQARSGHSKSPLQRTLNASMNQNQQNSDFQYKHMLPQHPEPQLNPKQFNYVPLLTDQPKLNHADQANQISMNPNGQYQYNSSHQRKVRRTINDQGSQMQNNQAWIQTKSEERKQIYHNNQMDNNHRQIRDENGNEVQIQEQAVFATEGDQWQNPMHYDSFGNPQFVGEMGQFDDAIFGGGQRQPQMMGQQYPGYSMAPNHQHPFENVNIQAPRMRGSIHYDKNLSNSQMILQQNEDRASRTAINTNAQVTHVAQISRSNDSDGGSSTLSPFPIEELDENINNENEIIDYNQQIVGATSDYVQQQHTYDFQLDHQDNDMYAGQFQHQHQDFNQQRNQQFTYEQQQYQQYWQNQHPQAQSQNTYHQIDYNNQLLRQNTSPDSNIYVQRDKHQNRQQHALNHNKASGQQIRTHYGDIEEDVNPISITPNQMSRKEHIQANQNFIISNQRAIYTAKQNKPVKLKKKAQYQQRFLSTTVAEEIGSLAGSVGLEQSFHPSQQAHSQIPIQSIQQKFYQADSEFDLNQSATPQGNIRPKRQKKQNQSQMMMNQKQPQLLQYQEQSGSHSAYVQDPSHSEKSKLGGTKDEVDYKGLITQIKDLFDNKIKILQPQVIRILQIQKQKKNYTSNTIIEEYNQISTQIIEKMRALLLFIKSYGENYTEQSNIKDKETEKMKSQVDKFSNDLTENASKTDDASYDVSPSKHRESARSNLNVTQLKKQVMEMLSPLRLVDMIQSSHSPNGPNPNYQIQFAAMQLLNQICDEVSINYQLICLAGLLSHLKEFSKENYSIEKQLSLNHDVNPKEIKVEVAYFLLKAYVTSNEAVMMIFANEGYKILGQFLQIQEYEDNKLLIFMAIDVFLLHFSQLIQNVLLPQAELSLIFIRENVSDKLAKIIPKLIENIKNSQPESEEHLIATKYIEKTFDLLQHLQNGNDEVKMQFCSKDLIQDCLISCSKQQMKQSTSISIQFLWRFMKLIQCLVQVNDNREKLFERLYNLNVIPCLVEILKYFFDSIETIQMTLIYDNLKLLSLLSSFSAPRTQQASQFGLLQILKLLIEYILSISEKFSQNKRVKLFTQILTLLQDNIENGSEFTKVEMLNQNLHILMFKIVNNFQHSINGYEQSIKNKQVVKKDQLKLQSKINKSHEINAKIIQIATIWLKQRNFVEQSKLQTSLGGEDLIVILIDLDQMYSFEMLDSVLEYSSILCTFCFQKKEVFEKLVQVLQKKIEQTTQQAKKYVSIQKNQQKVMHHNHAKSSPNFIHNDQSRSDIPSSVFQQNHKQITEISENQDEENKLQSSLNMIQTLLQIIIKFLNKGLPAHYTQKSGSPPLLHSDRAHIEEVKLDQSNNQSGSTQKLQIEDDEHLETDIVDDDEDLESNHLKINQINILNSQASASQPRAPMQKTVSMPMSVNTPVGSQTNKSKSKVITDLKDKIVALQKSIQYIENQYIGNEWLISNIDRRIKNLCILALQASEQSFQLPKLMETFNQLKNELQETQRSRHKLQGQSIYENMQGVIGDNNGQH